MLIPLILAIVAVTISPNPFTIGCLGFVIGVAISVFIIRERL